MSIIRKRRINETLRPKQTIRLFLDRKDDGFVFVLVSEHPGKRKPDVAPVNLGCGKAPVRFPTKSQAINTANQLGYSVDQRGFVTR